MDKKTSHWFTTGNMSQVIWQTSLPMVGAILALFSYDLFESSLLALSGADLLTALGFTLPLTTAIAAIAIGTSIRTNNKVVQVACLRKKELATTIGSSFAIATIVVIILSIVALAANGPLLKLLGNEQWSISSVSLGESKITSQQMLYMMVRYSGWICLTIIWQVNAVFRALGLSHFASGLMLSWLTLKSILALVLLVPTSAWYQEGLFGLALVHGVSDSIFAFISLALLMKKVEIKLPTIKSLSVQLCSPKFDGLIIILQQLITPLSMAILTIIAASISYNYVAAFALVLRMESIFLLLPMVLTTSMPTIIGTNFWSGHVTRVKQAYLFAFILITISQLIIAMVLNANSHFLSYLLCPQDSVVEHISQYLTWVPFGYFGAGCAIVYQSCLNAEGKAIQASALAFIHRIIILLPLALIGAQLSTENSFFQGIMLGHLLAGMFAFYIFIQKYGSLRMKYKHQKIDQPMKSS